MWLSPKFEKSKIKVNFSLNMSDESGNVTHLSEASVSKEPVINESGAPLAVAELTETEVSEGAAAELLLKNIPRSWNEKNVSQLLQNFGPIHSIRIFMDRTGASKGCAGIEFFLKKSALQATKSLHKIQVLPTMTRPVELIPLKQAQPEEGRQIFVGMLRKDTTAAELQVLFRPYGHIEKTELQLDSEGRSNGTAIITFYSKLSAARAIRLFHRSTTLEGNLAAITVRLAYCQIREEMKMKRKVLSHWQAMMVPQKPPSKYGYIWTKIRASLNAVPVTSSSSENFTEENLLLEQHSPKVLLGKRNHTSSTLHSEDFAQPCTKKPKLETKGSEAVGRVEHPRKDILVCDTNILIHHLSFIQSLLDRPQDESDAKMVLSAPWRLLQELDGIAHRKSGKKARTAIRFIADVSREKSNQIIFQTLKQAKKADSIIIPQHEDFPDNKDDHFLRCCLQLKAKYNGIATIRLLTEDILLRTKALRAAIITGNIEEATVWYGCSGAAECDKSEADDESENEDAEDSDSLKAVVNYVKNYRCITWRSLKSDCCPYSMLTYIRTDYNRLNKMIMSLNEMLVKKKQERISIKTLSAFVVNLGLLLDSSDEKPDAACVKTWLTSYRNKLLDLLVFSSAVSAEVAVLLKHGNRQ